MKLDSLSVPKLIQFGPNGLIDSFNFHTVVYDDIVINRNTLSPILDDQCFQILHLHDIAHSRIPKFVPDRLLTTNLITAGTAPTIFC